MSPVDRRGNQPWRTVPPTTDEAPPPPIVDHAPLPLVEDDDTDEE